MATLTNSRVSSRWCRVIREAKPCPILTSPFIKYTLIAAVPASFRYNKLHDIVELIFPWCKNKHTRIENIWPAYIRDGGKGCRYVKEVRQGMKRQNVRIQVYDFAVSFETKDMELGEDSPEIRPAL